MAGRAASSMAAGLAALFVSAHPAMAETPVAAPEPSPDFTFRRVVAPTAGNTGPRITVQIDPVEQARLLAPRPPAAPPPEVRPDPAPAAGFDWFWDLVPASGPPDPARFAEGIRALGAAPSGRPVPEPRVQTLQDIAARHGPDILRASVGTGVSPALVLAVIAVESGGRADAESGKGAQGLMQLIPATAERFGVTDSFDAAQNIAGGIAYLDWLLARFERDAVLALAGYNAGEGAVRNHDGVPPFAETRAYVPKVLAAWQVARGLCLTPPELPGDGCVFAVGAQRAAARP